VWAHVINCFVGVWLMAAPGVLGYGEPASTSDRVVGPFIATFACVAIAEYSRGCRPAVLPLALWLLIAPWILSYPLDATVNSMATGAAAGGLALVPGRVKRSYGAGWTGLFRKGAEGRIEPERDGSQPARSGDSTSTLSPHSTERARRSS